MNDLYSENLEIVSGLMDEQFKDEANYKGQLAKVWEKCINYTNGNQQSGPAAAPIIVNNQYTSSPNQDTRRNAYQDNEIEPIVRTIVSYMTRAKPAAEVFPGDKSQERKLKARLGERVLEGKYDLDNEYANSQMAAYWILAIGTCYGKDFWDPGRGGNAEVPVYDELGNEVIDPATGKVQLRQNTAGGNDTAVLTPFTVSHDHSVSNFELIPWIEENYLMPVDWVHESFGRDEEGYFAEAALEVTDDYRFNDTLNIFEGLKYSVPYSPAAVAPKCKGKTLIRERYIRPNQKFPKGRLIVKAGDKIVFGGDSPYYMPYERRMWHPYTMMGFEPYLGRLLFKGLVEQLISLQTRLTELNGSILENANTIAKPDILAAERQLKKGIINGKGGNIFTYRPRPDAPPPIKWAGMPLPEQFFKEKQEVIDAMVRIAGTNFVMQGTPPQGVSAASAIQQLLENANTQHSDLMNSWEKFHEARYTKKLRIIRNFNKYPEQELIDYIRTMSKDSLDMEISSFIGEDLGDGWTVKIEAGSMVPKSEKFKKDLYKEFATEGLLGPVQEDSARGARLRKELLGKFGEKGFDTEESADFEKAKWENERLKQGLPVEVYERDNDEIHLGCHVSEVKDPRFLERATDEVKAAYEDHIVAHEESLMSKQMEAAATAPVTEEAVMPAGAGGEGAAPELMEGNPTLQ